MNIANTHANELAAILEITDNEKIDHIALLIYSLITTLEDRILRQVEGIQNLPSQGRVKF